MNKTRARYVQWCRSKQLRLPSPSPTLVARRHRWSDREPRYGAPAQGRSWDRAAHRGNDDCNLVVQRTRDW